MNISKINSTAFRGTIYLQAREKDSLFETPKAIESEDIKKITDYETFSTILLRNKKEYFVSPDVPYNKLLQAYRLTKDFNADVKFL